MKSGMSFEYVADDFGSWSVSKQDVRGAHREPRGEMQRRCGRSDLRPRHLHDQSIGFAQLGGVILKPLEAIEHDSQKGWETS